MVQTNLWRGPTARVSVVSSRLYLSRKIG